LSFRAACPSWRETRWWKRGISVEGGPHPGPEPRPRSFDCAQDDCTRRHASDRPLFLPRPFDKLPPIPEASNDTPPRGLSPMADPVSEDQTVSGVPPIAVGDLLARVDEGAGKLLLLDLRDDDEFAGWRFEGRQPVETVHIPYSRFIDDA